MAVYLLKMLEDILQLHPSLGLVNVVDDIHLHVVGHKDMVEPAFTAGLATLTQGLRNLRPLNVQKTQILYCGKAKNFAHQLVRAYGFETAQYG
eukprot:4070610-Amphidinium_carterae.1